MKLFKKNMLYGGSGNDMTQNKKIQMFFAIIILGYFGIKIVYGLFFGYYPQKYYNRNIQITSNKHDKNVEDITLNAYVPGVWNNEMTDFITILVLSIVIYIFTNVSSSSIINEYGNLNISFLLGYIIGLGYPPIYTNYLNYYYQETNESPILKYMYLTLSIMVIIGVFFINYRTANNLGRSYQINYIIYVIVLILLIYGLYFSKKNQKNYEHVSYFNQTHNSLSHNKTGFIRSSGDKLNITVPFVAFIVILLFSYEPTELPMKNLYASLYGIFLGIIVSGVSYFGMEYFLVKQPEKQCNSLKDCIEPENIHKPDSELHDIDINYKLPNINMNIKKPTNLFKEYNVSILNVILFLFVILVAIYLFYYNFYNIKYNGSFATFLDRIL